MNLKYLPAWLNAFAKFSCMQKSNSPVLWFSPQFFGAAFFMLVQSVTAQYTPGNLQIPAFTSTTGTVLSNTNGNWITVNPQEPDNIGLLETNLYEMPHRGSGLMAVDFKLVGADGVLRNSCYIKQTAEKALN